MRDMHADADMAAHTTDATHSNAHIMCWHGYRPSLSLVIVRTLHKLSTCIPMLFSSPSPASFVSSLAGLWLSFGAAFPFPWRICHAMMPCNDAKPSALPLPHNDNRGHICGGNRLKVKCTWDTLDLFSIHRNGSLLTKYGIPASSS